MAVKRGKGAGLRRCPKCDMGMIVLDGFGLGPEHKTYECLQCGHIEEPDKPMKLSHAARSK